MKKTNTYAVREKSLLCLLCRFFHHLDNEPHISLGVAVSLSDVLSHPAHLVALCNQSLVILIYGKILHITATDTISVHQAHEWQIGLYQFIYCHSIALSCITSTCLCPRLMSSTLTTGLGSIATPRAKALASISSPCTLDDVCVAWMGTPPPN